MVAKLVGDDVILGQITSKPPSDVYAVSLGIDDFTSGGLHKQSTIRPNRVFTADARIVLYRTGHVSDAKLSEVVDVLVSVLKQA